MSEVDEGHEQAGEQAAEHRRWPRPSKVLPTTRIAFPKQLDILRAYGTLYAANGEPVSVARIAELVKMHRDTTRLVNPFFVDVGLLQKAQGGGLTPVSEVVAFHRAREWGKENPAHVLAPLFKEQWFATAILPTLAFRGKIEESEALHLLGDACRAPLQYRANLLMLLSYLEATGLLGRDGADLHAVKIDQPSAPAGNPKAVPEHRDVQVESEMDSQPVREVRLVKAGGKLTLSGTFNPFQLSGAERKLVYEIIDKMDEFERQTQGAAGGSASNDEEGGVV